MVVNEVPTSAHRALEIIREWATRLGDDVVQIQVTPDARDVQELFVRITPTRKGACGADLFLGSGVCDASIGSLTADNTEFTETTIREICRALEFGRVRQTIATVWGCQVWSDWEVELGQERWFDRRYSPLPLLAVIKSPQLRVIDYDPYVGHKEQKQ